MRTFVPRGRIAWLLLQGSAVLAFVLTAALLAGWAVSFRCPYSFGIILDAGSQLSASSVRGRIDIQYCTPERDPEKMRVVAMHEHRGFAFERIPPKSGLAQGIYDSANSLGFGYHRADFDDVRIYDVLAPQWLCGVPSGAAAFFAFHALRAGRAQDALANGAVHEVRL